MRPIFLCALLCCLAGCNNRSSLTDNLQLSDAELTAYEHIERTPNLTIFSVTRESEHRLSVSTRQGAERIRYVIDSSDPEAEPHEMVWRQPRSGVYRSYDRNKPRGTFQSAR